MRRKILRKVLFCANTPNFIQIGGRAYPVRHYPIAIRLRTREEYAILCIALNPQSGDFSDAILEVPSEALLHLRKVLFREKAPEYHSGVIDKEKHLQGRCCGRRTQYGCAVSCFGSRNMLNHANEESGLRKDFVLCIAFTPQSGDSSDAILEVPFKALLHPHA